MTDLTHRVSRRLVLAGLLAGVAAPALAEAPATSLRPPRRGGLAAQARRATAPPGAQALVAEARLGGQVGLAVADARTGQVLESLGGDTPLPPASVAKAITTLYALEALGAGHRFVTRLIATGPVRNGRVEGDLILTGTGDPTLDTDALSELAAGLRAAGVRTVTGRFLVHDGALPYIRSIDPGQPEHVGYNPAVSGLNLNFNRVHFEWQQGQDGYRVAMDARSERLRPAVSMARMRVADRRAPLFTYEDRAGVEDWTVAAAALGRNGSRWLPVRRPADYAGEVFQVLAQGQGIALPRPERAGTLSAPRPAAATGALAAGIAASALAAPAAAAPAGLPQGTVLAEHASDDLGAILTGMLKHSTNLTAEVAGLTASARLGGVPASLDASAARMNGWLAARIGVEGARFVDHSGLGADSRIRAADMVAALVRAGADGPLSRMMKRIELKDGNGRTIRNHPIEVRAKTGTLNFVSGLAGYVRVPSGRVLSFAIFAADLDRRRGLAPEDVERPEGGRGWITRAHRLQQALIERWGISYGA